VSGHPLLLCLQRRPLGQCAAIWAIGGRCGMLDRSRKRANRHTAQRAAAVPAAAAAGGPLGRSAAGLPWCVMLTMSPRKGQSLLCFSTVAQNVHGSRLPCPTLVQNVDYTQLAARHAVCAGGIPFIQAWLLSISMLLEQPVLQRCQPATSRHRDSGAEKLRRGDAHTGERAHQWDAAGVRQSVMQH